MTPSPAGRVARVVARFVAGFGVLLLAQLAGGWLARALGLPVPGSVLGLVLLAALVELRVVPLALVRPAADFLVRHLALLYVPAGAALVLHWGLVRREWLPIVAGGVASTVAVLVVAGLVYQRLERRT